MEIEYLQTRCFIPMESILFVLIKIKNSWAFEMIENICVFLLVSMCILQVSFGLGSQRDDLFFQEKLLEKQTYYFLFGAEFSTQNLVQSIFEAERPNYTLPQVQINITLVESFGLNNTSLILRQFMFLKERPFS